MRIGGHLETNDTHIIDVDDDAFDLKDLVVTRERILPRFERWMPDSRVDQIHFSHSASVVLKRCNFFRIR